MWLRENPQGILLSKAPEHFELCASLSEANVIIAFFICFFVFKLCAISHVLLIWCVITRNASYKSYFATHKLYY